MWPRLQGNTRQLYFTIILSNTVLFSALHNFFIPFINLKKILFMRHFIFKCVQLIFPSNLSFLRSISAENTSSPEQNLHIRNGSKFYHYERVDVIKICVKNSPVSSCCRAFSQLHFIFRHKHPKTGAFEEKHAKKPKADLENYFTDKKTHLYTLGE